MKDTSETAHARQFGTASVGGLVALGMLTVGAVLLFAAPQAEGYRYRVGVTAIAVLVVGLALVWAAPCWSGKDKAVATVLVVMGLFLTGAAIVHQEWFANPCLFSARYLPDSSPSGMPRACLLIGYYTPLHQIIEHLLAVLPAVAASLLALRRRSRADRRGLRSAAG